MFVVHEIEDKVADVQDDVADSERGQARMEENDVHSAMMCIGLRTTVHRSRSTPISRPSQLRRT